MPESSIREFADTTADPPVRGFLHTPAAPNQNGLVLTHGAGGNARSPLLGALAEFFSRAGGVVPSAEEIVEALEFRFASCLHQPEVMIHG